MSYYTLHIKSCFSINLHVIWPGEQFKVGSFFLKHPVFCTKNAVKSTVWYFSNNSP